jgi:hypothetical protein
MQLTGQRPLYVQGAAGHPGQKVVDTKKNNWKKMEGLGGGDAPGVADPPKNFYELTNIARYLLGRYLEVVPR